jgi:hypothetical protein
LEVAVAPHGEAAAAAYDTDVVTSKEAPVASVDQV